MKNCLIESSRETSLYNSREMKCHPILITQQLWKLFFCNWSKNQIVWIFTSSKNKYVLPSVLPMSVFLLFLFPYLFFFFLVDSNTNKLLKIQQGFNTSCVSWEDAQNTWGFWSKAGVLEPVWKPHFTCKLIGDKRSSVYSWLLHNCCTVVCRVSSLPIKTLACSAAIRGEGIDPACGVLPCFISKYLLGLESELCLFHVQWPVKRLALPVLPLSSSSAPFSPTDQLKLKVLLQLLLLGSDAGAFSIC